VVPRGLLEIAIPIRIDRRTKGLVVGQVATAARAAAVAVTDRVDRAEGGRSQSHHDGRVLAHRVRDTLATPDPGRDELEGVVSVDLGARRATHGATVAACHQEYASGLASRDHARKELAGVGVDALLPAAQANRVRAPAHANCSATSASAETGPT